MKLNNSFGTIALIMTLPINFSIYYDTFKLNSSLCTSDQLYAIPNSYKENYRKGVNEACSDFRLLNFRDGISRHQFIGTNYPGNLREDYSEEQYQKGYQFLQEKWLELSKRIDPSLLEIFSDNIIGNPLQFNFRKNKITTEYLFRHSYYIGMMGKLIGFQNKKWNILEIGAGYGGLCKLFFDIEIAKTYIIIDLPKSLLIEEYFLKTTFPEKRVGTSQDFIDFYHSATMIPIEKINKWDVIILPPPFIQLLPDQCVNLVINTHSLMEMNVDQINYYYFHIDRLASQFFYQCNRLNHKILTNYSYKNWPINLSLWGILYQEIQWNYPDILELLLKKNI